MQVQVHTDANIEGREGLIKHVRSVVEDTLSRFRGRVTRVEVHLNDEHSAQKSGRDDKRCVMEARLDGHQPVAVTAHAPSVHQAINAAADKLLRHVESTLGRLDDRR